MDHHPASLACPGPEDLAPSSFMGPVLAKHHSSCINFSLETAIIVIMVFGVGALFSCCYHWGLRLQHNQAQASSSPTDQSHLRDQDPPRSCTAAAAQKAQQMKEESTMQVLMPGDDVPKFIAWTAPHRIPPPHVLLDSSMVV
ncbi:unnamed protein product [Sphagnum compactum]